MIVCAITMIKKFHPAMLIENRIIKIESGLIIGEDNEGFYAYRGIPYAESPEGDLRFASPKRFSQTWEGIRPFKNYSQVCSQYDHFTYSYVGIEDCLTLNVFVPKSVVQSYISHFLNFKKTRNMRNIFGFIALLSVIYNLEFCCAQEKVVNIENGKIVGEEKENYYAFLGLPYAESPTGELRFAPPKRFTQTWDDVREFKKFGSMCAQYSQIGYSYHGIEDCLTLNVFVPKSVVQSYSKFPVIFFIHGGAFMYGGSNVYGPENIMRSQNMILVTVNYRLGTLGFMTTEDEVIPGNFGMKDQVEALKWVQRNIEAFNGDPTKVTIVGYSAGGASVHLHYMSPLSEGLFNNGISHSGCALNPWVMMENGKEKAHQVAKILNCPIDNHQKMLECLRKKPAKDLVIVAKEFQPFLYNPFSPFAVTVEKHSPTAFLTDQPLKFLMDKKFLNLSHFLNFKKTRNMRNIFGFIALLSVIYNLEFCCAQEKVVNIENGKIVGEEKENYYAFLGLPYAESPTGELRFAPPKRFTQTWDDVREFKKFGSMCAQYSQIGYSYHGDEDCLSLNVFVPKTVLDKDEKVPVIFFVHGGAFMFGGSDAYGPENIMRSQNMILVTVNYRLGTLGFMTTEDEVISGNFGMKDQVEALKWVQRNIEAFNGDPAKITIVGFSAGGASVHLHYMSPLSEGLFNNGISHSSCALNPWVMMENGKEKAHQVAKILNCPFDNHQKMLECLRKKPAKDLVIVAKEFQPFLYNPFSPFGVTVEKQSREAFLIEHPETLLKKGSFKKIPWILSQTQDEGLYPAAEFYNDHYLKEINDNWNELAPFILDFNGTICENDTKLQISEEIRQFYMKDQVIEKDSYDSLRDMITDRLYHHGAFKSLQYQSKYASVFFYYFRAITNSGIAPDLVAIGSNEVKINVPSEYLLGVSHGDDVFLIYNNLGSGTTFASYFRYCMMTELYMMERWERISIPKTEKFNLRRKELKMDEKNFYLSLSAKNYLKFDPVSQITNVFFDESQKQIFCAKPASISVKSLVQESFSFIIQSSPLIAIKFNVDNSILTIQRTENTLELYAFKDNQLLPNSSISFETKKTILGFFWIRTNELIIVTKENVEIFNVITSKKTLKSGRVAISIIDSIIIVHHQTSKVSLLFDVAINGEENVQERSVMNHTPLVPGKSIEPFSLKLPSVTHKENTMSVELYSANWVIFSDIIIDVRIGYLFKLELAINKIRIGDKLKLCNFLMHRQKEKSLLINTLLQLVSPEHGESVQLAILEVIFDNLNKVYKQKLDHDLVKMQSLPSPSTFKISTQQIVTPQLPNQIVIEQNDVLYVLNTIVDKNVLEKISLVYLFSLVKHSISCEYDLGKLIVSTLINGQKIDELQQILNFKAIHESKPLACFLLASSKNNPLISQMALDMLYRLNALEIIVEIFLEEGMAIDALRLSKQFTNPDFIPARKYLEAALKSDNKMVFYSVYKHFIARNQRLRGNIEFLKKMEQSLLELDNHQRCCRFCLKEFDTDDTQIKITPTVMLRFQELTEISLKTSDEYSNVICESCNTKLRNFNAFRKDLIFKQKCLEGFVEGFVEESLCFDRDTQLPQDVSIKSIKDESLEVKIEPKNEDEYAEYITTEYLENIQYENDAYQFQTEEYVLTDGMADEKHVNSRGRRKTSKIQYKRALCGICSNYYYKDQLQRHIDKVHYKIKRFWCDICGFGAFLKCNLSTHMAKHIAKEHRELICCSLCPSTFTRNESLKNHMKTEHDENPEMLKCFCGKEFNLRHKLTTHIKRTHNNDRSHVCELCPKRFFAPKDLKSHILIAHTPGYVRTEHFCEVCGKKYGSAKSLKTHMKHHQEPEFKCQFDGCPKAFINKLLLANHEKIHLNQRDFQCHFCEKSFFSANHLRRHIVVTHEKVRVNCFVESCRFSVGRKDYLRNHILSHRELSEEMKHAYLIQIRDMKL
ncbi:CLUMA_CG019612, isoform A [Clunio marinus]|uniref:CLUMA_CG019612, isoform A n=1 Tax=Clunio marinus TaxID=568069 RepID=A0A1J1J1Y9_9DIPT|nr:CLUMA_CG019612, isoform A [Clunio marinus]